jgi:chromosome segregation ATPase
MTEKELIVDDDRVNPDSWRALALLQERYMKEISTLQSDLGATRKLLRESVDQLSVRTAEFQDCQGRLEVSEDRRRRMEEERGRKMEEDWGPLPETGEELRAKIKEYQWRVKAFQHAEDAATETITALKAEFVRMNALENERADFLLRMIGDRSLEHFVVRWDELQAVNRRLRAALEKYADEKNWNGWHVTAKPWSIACEALVER